MAQLRKTLNHGNIPQLEVKNVHFTGTNTILSKTDTNANPKVSSVDPRGKFFL